VENHRPFPAASRAQEACLKQKESESSRPWVSFMNEIIENKSSGSILHKRGSFGPKSWSGQPQKLRQAKRRFYFYKSPSLDIRGKGLFSAL